MDFEIIITSAELTALSINDNAVKFADWLSDTLNATRVTGICNDEIMPYLKSACY